MIAFLLFVIALTLLIGADRVKRLFKIACALILAGAGVLLAVALF
jgi:hypothetical protein